MDHMKLILLLKNIVPLMKVLETILARSSITGKIQMSLKIFHFIFEHFLTFLFDHSCMQMNILTWQKWPGIIWQFLVNSTLIFYLKNIYLTFLFNISKPQVYL